MRLDQVSCVPAFEPSIPSVRFWRDTARNELDANSSDTEPGALTGRDRFQPASPIVAGMLRSVLMATLTLTAYLIVLAATWALRLLNRRHLQVHGGEVPPELAGIIEPDRMQTAVAYSLETGRLGMIRSALKSILLVLFLFGGWLGLYDRFIGSVTGSFVGGGVLFFLFLAWAETLLGIPFSLYRNFRIETRYGFNTMSLGLWATDLLKSFVLSSGLLAGMVAAGLFLVRLSPDWWWLWVWGFFLLLGIFLMYISPYVIEPLFHRFEPVRAEDLEARVRALMEGAGLAVGKVLQVDASRRSRHSNAYFTGIGRVKRIVLFDTLIEQMSEDEIVGVLAHEVGHWKMRHILKRLVVSEVVALAGLFAAFHLVGQERLPALIGLPEASFYARIVILSFVGSLCMFPLTPLFSYLSRRGEWGADRYAAGLTGRPGDLASALAKLSRENLANLHPHPLHSWFHDSHPPVVRRIRRLQEGMPARSEPATS